MKFFWRKKNDTILTWQLCIEPAALLLTIVKKEKGWWLKCLGKEQLFAGPSVTTEDAQTIACTWLSNELFLMWKGLEDGVSSEHSVGLNRSQREALDKR